MNDRVKVSFWLSTIGGLLLPFLPCAVHAQDPPKPCPIFTEEEVAAYKPKGPSVCYRYLCPDYNMVGGKPNEYFTKIDPVEYAAFCQKLNLDAALILFVPTEGYCAYPSKVGTPFPSLQKDWIAQAIAELHKRGISAFAYVTLGWNYKYAAEHPGCMSGDTICFNSPLCGPDPCLPSGDPAELSCGWNP